MNPKTEEIVKSLRGCSADEMDCKNCVAEWGRKYGYCFNSLRLYAADRLEELEKELADERYRHDRLQDFCVAQGEELSKLKAQQRWIPVTERLPEVDGKYIVCTAKNSVYCTRWRKDYFGTDFHTHVTHWMPLPEPPKEDANENENENAQG